ncbi:hypothetical protein IEQ34_008243 [Dendrobium chrysotoxum]|uniref:RING-type domain-containing protein n=1 Tax=Dendrobium chrysotoxum TaxID=161865 RepID=A0AAV7H3K4_DENCH|nr:hypothetical protein IEQ34_008243 [Dendrobium chrysotoxum]
MTPKCVICLSQFGEGEEIRQLLSCRHLFHLNTHSNHSICHDIVLLHSVNMST